MIFCDGKPQTWAIRKNDDNEEVSIVAVEDWFTEAADCILLVLVLFDDEDEVDDLALRFDLYLSFAADNFLNKVFAVVTGFWV